MQFATHLCYVLVYSWTVMFKCLYMADIAAVLDISCWSQSKLWKPIKMQGVARNSTRTISGILSSVLVSEFTWNQSHIRWKIFGVTGVFGVCGKFLLSTVRLCLNLFEWCTVMKFWCLFSHLCLRIFGDVDFVLPYTVRCQLYTVRIALLMMRITWCIS